MDFLASLDTFATEFEAKTSTGNEDLANATGDLISNGITDETLVEGTQSSKIPDTTVPMKVSIDSHDTVDSIADVATILAAADQVDAQHQQILQANKIIEKEKSAITSDLDVNLESRPNKNYDKIASELFLANNVEEDITTVTDSGENSSEIASKVKVEEPKEEALRVVTRLGSTKPTLTDITPKIAEDDDINVEEGSTVDINSLSHILTKDERKTLSIKERDTWRAKQADLNAKRKDFHGAVTLAFNGIFSWQMYGSTEALDENGIVYTEYLMRCQWGTTFENIEPWIVAHRYKEFDMLHNKVKSKYSSLAKSMPQLPKKEMFGNMDAQVIAKRRVTYKL